MLRCVIRPPLPAGQPQPGDTGEACWAVFTGDTLFVGDTGRTYLTDPSQTGHNAGLVHDAVHTIPGANHI